jgi:outer membrane receptor protein involved in Fe transport
LVDSYQLGNSFSAVYDNVTVFGINGNVAADFNNLKLQAGFDFNDYSMQDEAEAWNLPTLTGRIQANYIYNKWTLGAKLFLVSATKDSVLEFAQSIPTTVENDSYADLNLSGAYRFSDRLSAFLNLQNVFNQNYPRFYNYQVQPFQVLAGMMYKFDL